jgi:hypothetical protein
MNIRLAAVLHYPRLRYTIMKTILGIILSFFMISNANAQANIVSNPVNQSFSFPSNPSPAQASLPINWRLAKSNTVRTVNPYPVSPANKEDTTTQFRGGNLMAANSPAGIYNLGVGDSINAANRAVGFLADNNNVRSCNLYFHLRNAGPTAITSFNVEFFVRKFKNGSNPIGFQIQMYYSLDGVNWTDAGPDYLVGTSPDANDNGFVIPVPSIINVGGVLNQTVLPNQQFYFAWNYSVVAGSITANAPVYGIDAVIITPIVALPVSLVKFEAEKVAEKVKLNWVTATEINNDKFIIERSANGKDFEYLAELRGAGNSKELNIYEMVDVNPLKGTSYYQLTQVDFDGASETFAPVAVSMKQGVLSMEQGLGNVEQGTWSIYSPENTVATFTLTDLNGRVVYAEKINLVEGYQPYKFNTIEYNKGIYLARLATSKDVLTKKLNF